MPKKPKAPSKTETTPTARKLPGMTIKGKKPGWKDPTKGPKPKIRKK